MYESERVVFLEERLSVYLMMLKITPNLKGYIFLKDCAKIIYSDSTMKFHINEKLYNIVGSQYNETSSIIERALRHAIEVSIKREGIKEFEKFMKIEFYNDKPTPRELLCILVERAVVESKLMLENQPYLINRWKKDIIR